MKLRVIIFFTVAAIGLLPLLTLIGINLQGHMARHDEVASQELLNRAKLNQGRVTAEINHLRGSLRQAGELPTARLAIAGEPTAVSEFSRLLQGWFSNDPAVVALRFFAANGREQVSLRRPQPEAPLAISTEPGRALPPPLPPELLRRDRLQQSTVLLAPTEDGTTPAPLLCLVTIYDPAEQPIGYAQMELDHHSLTAAIAEGYWARADGTLVGAAPAADWPEPAPLAALFAKGSPFLWHPHDRLTIAWTPIILAPNPPLPLWLGTPLDRQAALLWKRALVINILEIVFVTMLLVFGLAHFLAAQVEQMRGAIVNGVERILNNEKEVAFAWCGPAELQTLAHDLTALGHRYATTREAHRQAEEELRASEDKFRKLTASAQDAIIIMDHQGAIAFWNQAAERIFGYPAADAMGQAVHALLDLRRPEQDPTVGQFPPFADNSLATPAHPESATLELIGRHRDSTDLPIELSLSAARIKEQWHAIWIVRDIRERKEAEAEAQRRRQQLVQADKMRSLGLLVAGVAHEINNPNSIALLNAPRLAKAWQQITPILEEYFHKHGDFMVAGLEYSELRPQIPRLFQELEESSRRIKQIVKDLKEYARQESSRELASIDLNEVVTTAVRLTRNLLHKTTRDFTCTHGTHLPKVRANHQRLSQVVINLLQNSCEALAGAKVAAIGVATRHNPEEGTVEIVIRDNGPGMTATELARITDPFYTTKRQLGGTGLGLSVSAGIVKEHQGRLHFQSTPGQGTVATVALPVNEDHRHG